MTSLQGHFLAASPHLGDPNFFRTVVLMIKHDAQGALGLVLTRPMQETVAELWQRVTAETIANTGSVHLGGPVNGPLVAIHRMASAAEAEVFDGVYFSAHSEQISRIVHQTKKPYLLFAGYSGWSGGQLEAELEQGGWLIAPATTELVFSSTDDLWERVVQSIGLAVLSPAIRTKHVPEDPTLN
ncbi:protein of unknown function DUF179 [Pirellula staleyi DSM 6068]|uniref:Uncharacterized protein n=1 Tax=Pirellula staleyi (strain ATCC 27377 / DSM 6068 / ICPB 4128) TaxID=530564 RepID=D2R140_PIRSD|nr:YqgE/AlgH family protein [Pirellula staleyi]ADB18525.1 protein of unknown function DUF179 [Pirellula staleyi DSM 6068]